MLSPLMVLTGVIAFHRSPRSTLSIVKTSFNTLTLLSSWGGPWSLNNKLTSALSWVEFQVVVESITPSPRDGTVSRSSPLYANLGKGVYSSTKPTRKVPPSRVSVERADLPLKKEKPKFFLHGSAKNTRTLVPKDRSLDRPCLNIRSAEWQLLESPWFVHGNSQWASPCWAHFKTRLISSFQPPRSSPRRDQLQEGGEQDQGRACQCPSANFRM